MLNRIIRLILRGIIDPVIFVTTLAPVSIQLAFLFIRDKILQTDLQNQIPEFYRLLTNPTAYALIDFSVQLYTACLGWIFLCFRLGPNFLHATRQNGDIDGRRVVGGAVCALVAIGGFYFFFIGGYWNVEVLQLYVKARVTFGFHFPPIESPITWARGVIFIIGLSAFWVGRNPVE